MEYPIVCEFWKDVEAELEVYPEALDFIKLYGAYCHALDDIIDEKNCDSEFVLSVAALGMRVYSSKFYHENINWLYPVILIIHNTYADSCLMEHSPIKWKREFGDAYRCCGNEIILAVLHHYKGYETMRKYSMRIREDSYRRHHTELGMPI